MHAVRTNAGGGLSKGRRSDLVTLTMTVEEAESVSRGLWTFGHEQVGNLPLSRSICRDAAITLDRSL